MRAGATRGPGPRRGPRGWRMPSPALCTLARPGQHIGPACTAGLAIARGQQGMGGVPVIVEDRVGRLVTCTRKRGHTGTVAGHRETCAPVGPRCILVERCLFHTRPLRRLRVALR